MNENELIVTKWLSGETYGCLIPISTYIDDLVDEKFRKSYKKEKPKYIFQFRFHENRRLYEKINYSNFGFVFIDIDRDDNPGLSSSKLKEIISGLPFTFLTNYSTNGGIHAVFRTDLLNKINQDNDSIEIIYKSGWAQISNYLLNMYGIITDQQSIALNQPMNLGNDSNPFINWECSEYIIDLNRLWIKLPEQEIDESELRDEYLMDWAYNSFKSNKGIMKLPFYLADKNNGIPISYTENIQFNPDKHVFIEHLDKGKILKYQFRNRNNTLAYNNVGFNVINYNFSSEIKIKRKKRTRFLIKYLLDFIHVNRNRKIIIMDYDENILIYNLIKAASKALFEIPFAVWEVNRVYWCVTNRIKDGVFKWKFKNKKTITVTKREFYCDMKSDEKPLPYYLRQIQECKTEYKNYVNSKIVNKLINKKNKKEMVLELIKQGKSKSSAYEFLNHNPVVRSRKVDFPVIHKYISPSSHRVDNLEFQPFVRNNVISNLVVQIIIKKTSKRDLIMQAVINLKNSGSKVTQKLISGITGININTVKTHWKNIKTDLLN
jgi:hypothetical protein